MYADLGLLISNSYASCLSKEYIITFVILSAVIMKLKEVRLIISSANTKIPFILYNLYYAYLIRKLSNVMSLIIMRCILGLNLNSYPFKLLIRL